MIRMRVGLVIFGNGILIEAGAGSGVPKSVLAANEAKDPDDETKDLGITTDMDKVRSMRNLTKYTDLNYVAGEQYG
jgi:hypothetical protein